ncbi:kinase-like domain-containing protein, partial [Fomes fomentarius]
LVETKPHAPGYRHICQLLDEFVEIGPNGTHICLVLEPLSVSVKDIAVAYQGRLPHSLLQLVSKHVLLALQYLHRCGIVHTDLKSDNILMAGRSISMNQTSIRLCLDDLIAHTFKLADFGAANLMSRRTDGMVQPQALRSPEVILKTDWDTKIDIWNLGCLAVRPWALSQALFKPHHNVGKSGLDVPQTHLAQIVCLFGNFPRKLLDRAQHRHPYCDDEGLLLYGENTYPPNTLQQLIEKSGYAREELLLLVDFLTRALAIDPEQRWSASRLLSHPWLQDVGQIE